MKRRQSVGRGGRFGKYGEHKRFERLRGGKLRDFITGARKRRDLRASHPSPWRAPGKSTRTLKLAFRRANPRDLPFIAHLSERVFSVYGPYGEIIARWASFPHIITVVVEAGGRPISFAMINPALGTQDLPKAELMAIAVAPQYQGRGIGRKLLEYMEELARGVGIQEMLLHTAAINKAAHRFFAKNGFIQKGSVECYYPMGQEAMEMAKKYF
jgi:ribosomal protein S18 acetylase RimI-like enzyme